MNAWESAVRRAIQRFENGDKGGQAARLGILGLPLDLDGKTAKRCYDAALMERTQKQTALTSKRRNLIPVGSTGDRNWDSALKVS